MIEETVPFASRTYGLILVILLGSRAMDFLSTWMATPNLVLEGNPLARKLGWRWGIPVNLALCVVFAFWPLPGLVISTTSVLVAARNFQSAWLMRSMGEHAYREWHVARIQETSATLYLLCLFAQTGLVAAVGAAIAYLAGEALPVVMSMGLGIIAYALAVLFYTMLAVVRLRRAQRRSLSAKPIVRRYPGELLPGPN